MLSERNYKELYSYENYKLKSLHLLDGHRRLLICINLVYCLLGSFRLSILEYPRNRGDKPKTDTHNSRAPGNQQGQLREPSQSRSI